MSGLVTTLALGALCVLVLLLFRGCRRPPGFPPGPPRIPILGSLPFMPHLPGVLTTAADWFITRYGKMVGIYLGDYPTVVLYDYDLAREVFSREDVTGRPDNFMYRFRMLGHKLGILFNDGEAWKNQRRFLLKTLKDFGFGKKSLEGVLLDEADRLGDLFKEKAEEPILVQNLFNVAILNVLWTIVANHRYELSDQKAQYVVKLITDSITVENLRFLFAVPFSRFIAPEWTGWNKQRTVIEETHQMMKDIVEQHVATYDEDNMRDFIDVYLREMKKEGCEDFHQDQLLVNAMDLFSAGSETTATTLSWAVCYMILYPEVQTRVQEELDAVIGDRKPSLDDRGKIPYTEATIMEIQRLGSIAPQAVPHRTLKDVTVRGCKIPRDTMVISMLYYIMRDPQHWDRPDEFRPERFIEDGKVIKEDRFVPFGVGKRVCIGESLAKTELFLILTRLLQLYRFESVPGKPQPTTTPVYGFILSPQPFFAKAVARS